MEVTLIAFAVDGKRYGLDVTDILTVMPVPGLRPLDGAPPWVAGVMQLRGDVVPVVDVTMLHAARPTRRVFGSRVILVRYRTRRGDVRMLGLLAEDVTDVATVAVEALREPGVTLTDAPWLGPLAPDAAGNLVQLITLADVLPTAVHDLLFPGADPR
jgi:chemotaxis-related protein WspB